MVNNRQQYVAQNMSQRYCLKVIKFQCTSFNDQKEQWRKVPTGGGGGGEGAQCVPRTHKVKLVAV